jgi:hypothetical protein
MKLNLEGVITKGKFKGKNFEIEMGKSGMFHKIKLKGGKIDLTNEAIVTHLNITLTPKDPAKIIMEVVDA